MFQGEYDHSIDDKGRVIIPTKFRSLLGDRFYITKGYSGPCLWVFTEQEWNSFIDALDRRPQLDEDTVMLKRFFTSTEASTDGQGRVAIPMKLRAYAKIVEQSPVVIVGTGSKFEIWSAAEWYKYNDNITAEMIGKAARGIGI